MFGGLLHMSVSATSNQLKTNTAPHCPHAIGLWGAAAKTEVRTTGELAEAKAPVIGGSRSPDSENEGRGMREFCVFLFSLRLSCAV